MCEARFWELFEDPSITNKGVNETQNCTISLAPEEGMLEAEEILTNLDHFWRWELIEKVPESSMGQCCGLYCPFPPILMFGALTFCIKVFGGGTYDCCHFVFLYLYFVLFCIWGSHTWQCSGAASSTVFQGHFWCCCVAGDRPWCLPHICA